MIGKMPKGDWYAWCQGLFSLMAVSTLLIGCSGAGSVSGAAASESSATTREITGNVGSGTTSQSVSKALRSTAPAGADCAADTVTASDSDGTQISADVDAACDFRLGVDPEQSYRVAFERNGSFVGTLTFDSGADGTMSAMVPRGPRRIALELGRITFSGSMGMPEFNPLASNDADDDGDVDLVDRDDDNNAVDDEDEPDCNHDGMPDGMQPEHVRIRAEAESTADARTARILQVKPDAWIGEPVGLKRIVKIMASCRIAADSVTAETFTVTTADGSDEIACDFSYGFWRPAPRFLEQRLPRPRQIVKCRHSEDFAANTEYTATIRGLTCLDGTPVENISWSWTTAGIEAVEEDAQDALEAATEPTETDVEADAQAEAEIEATTGNTTIAE